MKTITIGRKVTNDVVVDSVIVSGQHAVITIGDDGIPVIRDLNSTNGTFVNNHRISQPTRLNDGDIVKFGGYVFDWKAALRAPSPAPKPKKEPVMLPADAVESRTIGRDASAQIRFANDDVSGIHAYLYKNKNNEIVLMDANSTNGTYVNGERISSIVLHPGDKVSISRKYVLQWENVFTTAAPKAPEKKKGGSKGCLYALLIIVLIALGVGGYYYVSNAAPKPEKIYENYKKSVVMVVTKYAYSVKYQDKLLSYYLEDPSFDYFYVNNGEIERGAAQSGGTGFFISNDGKIMTNRHVAYPYKKEDADLIKSAIVKAFNVDYPDDIKVEFVQFGLSIIRNDQFVNSENDLINCVLLKYSKDEDVDVAVIQTNTKTTPADVTHIVDIKSFNADNMKLGKSVYTIGFPTLFIIGETQVGLQANFQNGQITQERGEYIYGHNIPILQGSSGSPVFDEKGNFAGIIVSGFIGVSQGYNHAIKPECVSKFYNY